MRHGGFIPIMCCVLAFGLKLPPLNGQVPLGTTLIAGSRMDQRGDSPVGDPILAGESVTSPLTLFFSDLESGPGTGGQDNLGTFVTLLGEGFGAERGGSTVTIGGHEVARYLIWGENNAVARNLDTIVVQIGPEVSTGNMVVTVNGIPSNPLPFTVRPGDLCFVSTTGSDVTGDGSFELPWGTIAHAKNNLAPGDVAYIMDGVSQVAEDNFGAALAIDTSGLPGLPLAIVGYPGAIATIGSTALEVGVRIPNLPEVSADYWVIANLVLRGQVQAMDIGGAGSSQWRVVGNDISCPVGDGQTGCFAAALADRIAFLGNQVHDISSQGPLPSKQYHAVYFTTDSNDIEVGWNEIRDNFTCRAIQFHSSPLCVPECGAADTTGFNQHDLLVHDNLIHGDVCDGIVFATVDPSQGPVRAYNNVIYEVGRGPSPPDGDANYSGIYVAGGTNSGPDGTGTVEIFNNVLFDCGRAQGVPVDNTDKGAFGRGPGSPQLLMELVNNIVYEVSGEEYLSASSATELMRGSNNLWFGSGPAPDVFSDNLSVDPMFENLSGRDFRLASGSQAIDSGSAEGVPLPPYDYLGWDRVRGQSVDRGPFERGEGLGEPTPTPSATGPMETPTATATPGGPPIETPTPLAEDINRDGRVNALDQLLLLRQWHRGTND